MTATGEDLVRIYEEASTIAVVGASDSEERDAHTVPAYLQGHGYRVIPVNPRGGEILGERVYRSLSEIEDPVDVIDVFRPPEEAEDIAREAIAIGTKVLWFQPGTETDRAIEITEDAGITVVARRCIRATHKELVLTDKGNAR